MQESLVTISGLTNPSAGQVCQSSLPTLIVMLAGSPVPTVLAKYGSYHQIFCQLFRNALNSRTLPEAPSGGVRVISFDSVAEEYPTAENLNSATGLLVTGSASSAYEPLPWITRLTSFCADLPVLYPGLKLFGICFGHQIFALAFGTVVNKNPEGWEIGVRDVRLSDVGKKLMDIHRTGVIRLHQLHQDHVVGVPAHCFSLGSTPACPIHGFIRFASHVGPNESDVPSDISVLAVQGHPEFNPDVILKVIDARQESGVFSKSLAEESRQYAQLHDDGIWFGSFILAIMGV